MNSLYGSPILPSETINFHFLKIVSNILIIRIIHSMKKSSTDLYGAINELKKTYQPKRH
jgi:hypothetical protein